ncbi:MAG TPA: TfuA-like protein [Pseudonocardiaceae bacterium]|nr:TfuA-like protein [Pseudonocardiaceae bacterium]
MTVHVFVGPTLTGQDVLDILPGAVVHPPVAHGDLLRLRPDRGDVVVVVDGYYHQSPSVRHKEILALLADGVGVVGCASMGALRAAELSVYGMVGSGVVFTMYADGVIDSDAEVALAHSPAPEYRSFTVALVVVRHAVESARLAGALSVEDGKLLVAIAEKIHYTERSWDAIHRAAVAHSAGAAAALVRLRSFVAEHPQAGDIKGADAVDTLRAVADGELPGSRQSRSWTASEWRSRFLDEWETEFSVTEIDNVEVSRSAIIRYQQLYRDDFAAYWQRFVLAYIAGEHVVGDDADGADLVDRALAVAARYGLTAQSVTERQVRYWLTEREAAQLSDVDALVRILVRSHQTLRPTRDLADAEPDLRTDPVAMHAVASAQLINTEVESWGSRHTVEHLKPAALREHLARQWRVESADTEALLAVARDRGFVSVDEALDAARPFFLHKRFLVADPTLTGAETR